MTTTPPLAIMWFRQDLRLQDNPALTAAIKTGRVLPIYILDDINAGDDKMGKASRSWLHQSLQQLDQGLAGNLNLYCGNATEIINALCEQFNITEVYWNRCYEPWRIQRDKHIKQNLADQHISAHSFNGSLLTEPWSVLKKDDTPYKVFTPYYKLASTLDINSSNSWSTDSQPTWQSDPQCLTIDALKLAPKQPWDKGFYQHRQTGEEAALQQLQQFISERINQYHEGRDQPAINAVSQLSPHLHFGEIAPWRIINDVKKQAPDNAHSEHFIREVYWREFSYYLLYHWPDLPKYNLRDNLAGFPWVENQDILARWQNGTTGIPFVDAGMRELWQTGVMHNRVRMITASFLVKNLLIDWRAGAAWFWDCLVDADLASNSASWQWVAGCGTDASPYFRIFNPVTQGEKFDAEGKYLKRFLPELKDLPDQYLFRPWEAPEEILQAAGIVLGKNYPYPIADLKETRENALATYQSSKLFREAYKLDG